MSQSPIFLPMGVLALWTMTILLLVPFRRFRASFAGKVKSDDFKYGESANVPGEVSIPNRALMNLLELPVLFYIVCLMFIVSGTVTPTVLGVAWAYVGFRMAQTIVHITYNNVFHRLTIFAIGNFVLLALWIMFFFPMMTR